jgi:hypothetical protein
MSMMFCRTGAMLGLVVGLAGSADAQPPAKAEMTATPGAATAPGTGGPAERESALETRNRLHELLRQYPPAVSDVLRLSPRLLTEPSYLEPYPVLAGFLAERPDIAQNPGFYLGTARQVWDTDAARRARAVDEIFAGFGVFAGLMTLLGVVVWLLRSMMDHQRWKRALKVQADAHTKLVERLSSTEDVLAYAQSPAGRHFLESGAPLEAPRRDVSAPLGRILWSVQMGMVMTVLGLGLFYCSSSFASGSRLGADAGLADASPFLFLLGSVTMSVGVGFLLSALMSYLLSRRLGLIGTPESSHA